MFIGDVQQISTIHTENFFNFLRKLTWEIDGHQKNSKIARDPVYEDSTAQQTDTNTNALIRRSLLQMPCSLVRRNLMQCYVIRHRLA